LLNGIERSEIPAKGEVPALNIGVRVLQERRLESGLVRPRPGHKCPF
jgi:hypothetical protein